MRASIVTFLRVGLGVGVFTIPHYTRNVGISTGMVMILIACMINYYTYNTLFICLNRY